MLDFLKTRAQKRDEIRSQPFPEAWREILEQNVPYYLRRLDEADQEELRGHLQVFLAEKTFEGCGGLEITDEIRVTIAAQACLLLLHRETDYYPDLEIILVYPAGYRAPAREIVEGGVVIEGDQSRLGESWTRGMVVLSWEGVLTGAADISDGHNLVLHEFAHQLDQESGAVDGAPELPRRSMYAAWARILGREYHQLQRDDARMRPTVIDPYGATNPAEFFAVITEAFFERPRKLRACHPELYELLKEFYNQDPGHEG
ncbi:zinc-dependent peptidase [Chondromyces apiculatus]|uniref:Inner membrane protein n=1 Tax=Chondromyces apiculatus DSM 436 TaxID=1192034 RepID=A0A017SZ99_9BACT|nr:M90 family metallopeptidase [Chondromyces apiculatus]EYF02303.1 Hypothetical protein CAP_7232 [Chondromyces apiculatus DSM 436]